MKIALVTQGFQTAGGVQAVARWLRSGLVARGHDVHIYDLESSRRGGASRRLFAPLTWARGPELVPGDEPGVTVVGASIAELEPMRYWPSKRLTSALGEYDLVQVVCGGPALARVARTARKPVAIQVATFMKWERESIHAALPVGQRLAKRLLTVWVGLQEVRSLRGANVVMVENDLMLKTVGDLAPDVTCVNAPPGVDTRVFLPAGNWNSKGPVVALGRLGETRKAWGRIISSYASMIEEWPDAPPLVMAGRGALSDRDATALQAAGLLGRVTVLSDVPHDELVALLQQGSVFWQTSHEEGLGIAALEAMACGVPVIATDTAGTRMTVEHGKTGYLVPQDDSEIPKLFREYTRRIVDGEGHRMSEEARRTAVERFDAQVTLDAFERHYRLMVSPGR